MQFLPDDQWDVEVPKSRAVQLSSCILFWRLLFRGFQDASCFLDPDALNSLLKRGAA